MVLIVNIETLKHCQSGLKINNGIKQCVKYTIVKTHEWQWTSFPKGNCDKIIKIKNYIVITTYRQISVKDTP